MLEFRFTHYTFIDLENTRQSNNLFSQAMRSRTIKRKKNPFTLPSSDCKSRTHCPLVAGNLTHRP